MAPLDGQGSEVTDEAALTWRDRARSRTKAAWLLAGAAVIALGFLLNALTVGPFHIVSACRPSPCPPAQLDSLWVAVTALGTLGSGVGALVSAVSAVRANRAARDAIAAPVKKPRAKSSVKRTSKR